MVAERPPRPAAERTVQIDNDRVRVSHWHFEPDAATGWHRHEFDYVIVPLLAGTLEVDDGEETTTTELEPGGSYFRPAGVEHDVANASGHEFAFVEIELKSGSA
ncbi:MAG TPA: cupin domain-containing protein [Gaiellaceae bacterium]|nr:cupin domain-containing protein [Gaiellaceae bacterium]